MLAETVFAVWTDSIRRKESGVIVSPRVAGKETDERYELANAPSVARVFEDYAQRLLGTRDKPNLEAWLVPVHWALPRRIRWTGRIKGVPSAVMEMRYLPRLVPGLGRLGVRPPAGRDLHREAAAGAERQPPRVGIEPSLVDVPAVLIRFHAVKSTGFDFELLVLDADSDHFVGYVR